jgi:NAD(P)H-hydrate repair Nnr-like enzyme with NAD(P)H-hydrate dehydratase domain
VRLCDVAQQVLLAQHPGSHAFSLGVFVTMHGEAGSRTAAAKSASITARDVVTLLIIALF